MNTTKNLKAVVSGLFNRIGGIVIAFIILCIGLSIASPYFLTLENILIVLRQSLFVMIIAFSMTFVIAMGGIDLSVGAIVAIVGVFVAMMIMSGMHISLVLILGLLAGAGLGAMNGLLISGIGVPPFIATLGMLSVLRGMVMVLTRGVPIYGLPGRLFRYLAQGYVSIIPFPILIAVMLFFISWFLLKKMKFGRYILATGSNEEAAGLVGINIAKIKIIAYTLSGLFSAVSAILLTSRSEAALPEAGVSFELDVIAAVVIGGTSLSGGKANLIGTVIGALVMAIVRNGLNLLSINVFWHQVVIGVIIIIAVSADTIGKKRIK